MKISILFSILAAILVFNCELTPPDIVEGSLDDSAATGAMDTAYYLAPGENIVSVGYKAEIESLATANPAGLEDKFLSKPVMIAVHGFGATTLEWREYKEYIDTLTTDAYISLISMGGHGQSYDVMKKTEWKDWFKPALEEYQALKALGFKNINFAVSSTAGALIIHYLSESYFTAQDTMLNYIFMIDPIIVPGEKNKLLTLIDVAGPILGNSINKLDSAELDYWYQSRSAEALQELLDLITVARKELEDGVTLPPWVKCKVYKSVDDKVVASTSGLAIYKGMKLHSTTDPENSNIELKFIDSGLHVFTRLLLRSESEASPEAYATQLATFDEMTTKANQWYRDKEAFKQLAP